MSGQRMVNGFRRVRVPGARCIWVRETVDLDASPPNSSRFNSTIDVEDSPIFVEDSPIVVVDSPIVVEDSPIVIEDSPLVVVNYHVPLAVPLVVPKIGGIK